jgi:hypothetical protein
MSPVNVWAVLCAAVAAWLTGFAWYTLLAGAWASALDTSMEHLRREHEASAGTPAGWARFALAFAAELIMAWVLTGLMVLIGSFTLRGGLTISFLAWLGFVVTPMAVNNSFAGRKPMLTVIDAGHWLVALLVMGAIIGAFG